MKHVLFLLRSHPELTDRWDHHVRSIHFYEPLPDFRRITREQLAKHRVSPAIDFRIEAQRDLVGRLAGVVGNEIVELGMRPPPEGFDFKNGYFAGLDAAAYYAVIRT